MHGKKTFKKILEIFLKENKDWDLNLFKSEACILSLTNVKLKIAQRV